MAAWASPLHFRVYTGYRTGTKHRATAGRRAEVGMDDPQEGSSTVGGVKRRTPRRRRAAAAKTTNAQTSKNRIWPARRTRWRTFSNDSRSIPPKGSVLLQHCDTKSSVAVQTADSVEHEDSLWDWPMTFIMTTAVRRQDQKRRSSGAPSKKLDRTPETSAPHSADSEQGSRPKPAATITRTPPAVLERTTGPHPGYRS